MFISQGNADLEIKTNQGKTPLLLAVSQHHPHIVEFLVKRGKQQCFSCVNSAYSELLLSKFIIYYQCIPGILKICLLTCVHPIT